MGQKTFTLTLRRRRQLYLALQTKHALRSVYPAEAAELKNANSKQGLQALEGIIYSICIEISKRHQFYYKTPWQNHERRWSRNPALYRCSGGFTYEILQHRNQLRYSLLIGDPQPWWKLHWYRGLRDCTC